eukprot:TRINITY_DN931_c0_g5_i2.p1 TRINITY_DN931_c0_g5~~TRINITY_DN931_c0_g5_i2.p1  ORF type:complete len:304 (+),score=57.35 TRINITY_DN931_c0_g5_i2:87-914(+)
MAPAAFAPIDVEQAAEESDSQTSHSRSWKIFAVGGTLLLAAALVFGAKNAGEERPGLAMPPSAGAPSELINENSQPMLHNCFSKELWSDDKKDWCCKHGGFGCGKGLLKPEHGKGLLKPEHNCFSKESWSDDKKDWCCKHKSLGCGKGLLTPEHGKGLLKPQENCFSKELWSDDKKDWCCKHKGLGCGKGLLTSKHNCFSKALWSDDKKDWCCEQKGLGCTSSYSIKRVSKWKQEQTHKIGGMSRTRLRIIPGAVDVRPKVPLPPGAIDVRPDKA